MSSLAQRLKAIIEETWEEWDKDNDHRVGKLLKALAGRCPGYRADIDQLLKDLERLAPPRSDDILNSDAWMIGPPHSEGECR